MNTRDIIVVRKVCETKLLSKAAGELYLTPQAVSQNVKRVENELGVTLFNRGNGGMTMTKQGVIFYEKSQTLIDYLEEMGRLFRLDETTQKGEIKVAVSLGIVAEIMPETIWNFSEQYPNFNVKVIEGTDVKVENLVRNGSVDMGITLAPVDENEFLTLPWCELEQCALIHKNNPLAMKIGDAEEISILDLKDVPLVVENKDFKIYRQIQDLCHRWGFQPDIYFESTEISLAHQLAEANKAVAVVPRCTINLNEHKNLKAVSFAEEFSWKWVFIKPVGEQFGEMENRFIDYLIDKTGYEGRMY